MTGSRHVVPEKASAQDRKLTLSMLNDHVPISLILDMSSPAGPDSENLLREENSDTEDWIQPAG